MSMSQKWLNRKKNDNDRENRGPMRGEKWQERCTMTVEGEER